MLIARNTYASSLLEEVYSICKKNVAGLLHGFSLGAHAFSRARAGVCAHDEQLLVKLPASEN
jgi:hypothetical protein